MTADQSSPVAAGDAGGGDVEGLAVEMCVANPTPHMYGGTHDAHRWGPCVAHEEAAHWLLASPCLADLLQAARAEGAREALEEAADDQESMLLTAMDGDVLLVDCGHFGHETGQVGLGDARPTDITRWARDYLRARAASVWRGGVEGGESAFEGAVGDAQVSGEGFGDQETQGRENGDSE